MPEPITQTYSTPMLSAQALSATLPGDEGPVRVLDAITFAIAAAEVVDIVGPSGSGKTTFLRALARLLPPATGELSLEATPATEISAQRWRALVALVPQRPSLVSGCVRDNLLQPWSLKIRAGESRPDETALRAALDAVGLSDVALDRDATRLSVGQQARLALARVTMTRPKVLLLDEADAALDDESARRVSEATARFAADGGAVVRVRHRGTDGVAARRLRLADGHLEPQDAS